MAEVQDIKPGQIWHHWVNPQVTEGVEILDRPFKVAGEWWVAVARPSLDREREGVFPRVIDAMHLVQHGELIRDCGV